MIDFAAALRAAQRKYDRTESVDNRTDAEIERDAEAMVAELKRNPLTAMIFDEQLWANVAAAREAEQEKRASIRTAA